MAQVAGAVLFAVLSAQCVYAHFDDIILQEGSNGSAVVLLTIARLQQSGIFADDNELLRRIAYVETRDGTAENTYRQGYNGGIWAVDENIFNDTQNINIYPRLRAKFDQIRRQFNVDWCSVRWSDLRKPLYSAIAARLASYNFPRTIPKARDISAQAQLWADYYRQEGSLSEFVTVASELQGTALESTANEFFVAFTYNLGQPPTLRLFVTTSEQIPVNFSVTTLTGFSFNGTATRQSTTTVLLPSSLQVRNNTERNKGIYIKAEGNKRIVVYGLNYRRFTSDAFLALPCKRSTVDEYEYYALTYHADCCGPSTILIIACEDNTTITTPSMTIALNRQQTYLIRESRDLSGTRVVSTKPISFFSGHECTRIPSGVGACDILTEQVPPTNTWGSFFLGASFLGKSSGALYRVLTAHDSTTVTVNCTTMARPTTYTLSTAGSWQQFSALTNSFCSIESNNPVLVMEYTQGFDLDNVGDPLMTMIPPVEQYSNNYVFNVLPVFGTNYITVYVAPEYFQPERIFVDNANLLTNSWTAVYCSTGTLCGYVTRQSLTAGEHSLYHEDTDARVGVSAYGFNRYNSYGYPGGLELTPILLATVSFSAATYSAVENEGMISISITRGGDTESVAVVLVATETFQGSASAGQDYTPLTQILEFQPGETQTNITITIHDDQKIEADEQFELYLIGGIGVHLSPFPRASITIQNDDGIITLIPCHGNVLGGSPIIVSGPYFTVQEVDQITCLFNDTAVDGIFINKQQVLCVSPPLSQTGRVPFQLFVRGNTTFYGESVFVSVPFMKAYEVYIDNDDLLFSSGAPVTVYWSPQTILPVESPGSYSVDILLMELNLTNGKWEHLVTVGTNLTNNGSAELKIPEIEVMDNVNSSFSPVVVQVSVSSVSTSVVDKKTFNLLKKLGKLAHRILKHSAVRYLRKLARQAAQRLLCEAWSHLQPDNIGQEILDRLPSCPRTSAGARAPNSGFKEERFSSSIQVVGKIQNFFKTTIIDDKVREFFNPGTSSCFRQIVTDRSQTGDSGQQCCYDRRGNLITGSPGGGTVDLVSPDISFVAHFIHDVIPFLLCCKAGTFSDCSEYYQHRPSDTSALFDPPIPAFVLGDPHIITLDGHKYTFNGNGEFVLIQTPDDSFTLQGRMVPAKDTSGSSVLATVFTAIVGKQADSDTVQFELTENGTTAFVNGEPLDFSHLSEQEYNNVTVTDLGNNTLSATFSSGAYLEAKEENGIISVLIVSLPESFRGTLSTGLMGSFNGNASDDLLPNLGTNPLPLDSCSAGSFNGSTDNLKNQGINPLPLNSSLQEIHELFGLTWIIDSPANSLFTYQPGESWATYYDPYFVPTYQMLFNDSDLAAQADELCSDDPFCLFDIAATGRVDIGLSTLQGSQDFQQLVEISLPVVCDPPCENGVCVANDTCNCAAGYQGERCTEQVISQCEQNPCENGGTCRKHALSYMCVCLPGFNGSLCQFEVDEMCDPPCENGTCATNNTCNCFAGYQGERCTEEVVVCDPPCENGVCVANDICNCTIGYEGDRCTEPTEKSNGSRQCVSRKEVRAEINTLRAELNSWLNTTLSILKTNLVEQSMGECACTSDIKQLLGKMDIIQNSVAANNASYRESTTLQQQLLQYVLEQNETLQQIANRVPEKSVQNFPNGTFQNPAPSCKDIEQGSPSGYYWVQRRATGYATQVYCNMTRRCCGGTGMWMRVADLDMTNSNHNCPQGFRTVTSPKRMCGRQSGPGCVSTTFPVHGIQYQNVCGRAIGYQDNSPNAFEPYYDNRLITIDGTYLDGISITHGHHPRKHIWSFAAALDETYSNEFVCPCTTNTPFTGIVPPFVGQDYFCDTGSRSTYEDRIYSGDPLWDGHGCGAGSSCCRFNSPPWFCKQLSQPTSDDIELRLCADQGIVNEDVLIELVELYVQ